MIPRRIALGFAFATAVALGHLGTILLAPHAIMEVAMWRLSSDGGRMNAFRFALRPGPGFHTVVRASPDVAYASCVYDLSQGPIVVSAAPSRDKGFASVAVFAANSDNIAAFNTIAHPQGIAFVLALPNQAVRRNLPVVRATTTRGIILDRRLAPDAASFAVADAARRSDRCS